MRVILKPFAIILLLVVLISISGYAVYWQVVATSEREGARGIGIPFSLDSNAPIRLVTSPTKKAWVDFSVARFKEKYPQEPPIEVEAVETRQALHDLLDGKLKATVWIADNSIWVNRFYEAWQEQKGGKELFNLTSANDYRTYLQTPVVFVTTREKAKFLRAYIEGNRAWENIRHLSAGKIKTPWGRFSYTHSDPTSTDLGFTVVAMILAEASAKFQGDSQSAVKSTAFEQLLTDLKQGFVFDTHTKSAASAPLEAFAKDNALYDMVCAYESDAIKALEKNKNLEVLYPQSTMASQVSAVLLANAEGVTPRQREVARKFMELLDDIDSIKMGLYDRLRPYRETNSLSIRNVITPVVEQGVRPTVSLTQSPSYIAINDALAGWNNVFQNSGSRQPSR